MIFWQIFQRSYVCYISLIASILHLLKISRIASILHLLNVRVKTGTDTELYETKISKFPMLELNNMYMEIFTFRCSTHHHLYSFIGSQI
jgi:hypothetical protein